MLHRASAFLLALALGGVPAGVGSAAGLERDSDRLALIRLLHDARFDEAEERLAASGGIAPGPERDFLRAFVLYWRLLYDDDNVALRTAFSSRLETALASAEARLNEAPDDGEALLWSGTAHLLLAEVRASERRPIAAAREARSARRALSTIPDADPRRADASFGLGTVDVLAGDLPTLAKGLGSLLGLTGERDRGLRELERAAREGRIFALESRIFLLGVRSSRKKRDYSEALAEAGRVSRSTPRSVAALDGAARVKTMLGDPLGALSDVDAALGMAKDAPRTDRGALASLHVQAARAELALFRPDRALERVRGLVALGTGLPPDVKKAAAAVVRTAGETIASPPWLPELAPVLGATSPPPPGRPEPPGARAWASAIPALELERAGDLAAAADRFAGLASESAGDPVLELLAGRGALLAGRALAARERLSRAAASPLLPKAWVGPCLLLGGRAADLAGDRAAATSLYRRATEAPAFIEKEAAWLHLSVPYRGSS